MTWIIRKLPGYPDVTAEHRASGVRLTLGHKTWCICEQCLDVKPRSAVLAWLRSLPEPPSELVDSLRERHGKEG